MTVKRLSAMRVAYTPNPLEESAIGTDPLALFEAWFQEIVAGGIVEPNAMALATATAEGAPSVRIVLLKGMTAEGAEFYSNYESRKGRELTENPRAAGVMLWHEAGRQVRFEGEVVRLTERQSDEYFASRPLGSRISAVASPQSREVAGRAELESRWQAAQSQADRRPDSWGGFRIKISRWEFWQGGADRLHDRIQFDTDGDSWRLKRLAP